MAPNKGGIALQSMPTEARTFELRKKDLDHPALRLDKMRAAIPKEAFVKSVVGLCFTWLSIMACGWPVCIASSNSITAITTPLPLSGKGPPLWHFGM